MQAVWALPGSLGALVVSYSGAPGVNAPSSLSKGGVVVERELNAIELDGRVLVDPGAQHPHRLRPALGPAALLALVKIASRYTSHPMVEGAGAEHAVRMVAFPPQTTVGITSPSDVALYELFQELENTAEKISSRTGEPMAADELALAAASLERASAALAAGVERAAYAVGSVLETFDLPARHPRTPGAPSAGGFTAWPTLFATAASSPRSSGTRSSAPGL